MTNTKVLMDQFLKGMHDERLKDIYVDESRVKDMKLRYIHAVNTFEQLFGEGDVTIFSAPGRSEIGGNHTDHQHGEVLAASINKDCLGVVRKTETNLVSLISEGYDLITVSLDDLELKDAEKETTLSLIKGVLAGAKKRGYQIGGFEAYVTSDVLIGAGLSSSAAFEVLIGTIISGLFNEWSMTPIEIAIISQYAENVYFGKPSGLMDQMASSVGSLVHIDFKCPEEPVVEKVAYDFDKEGYSLCITDTKGSHADLTYEYAAVPMEMKAVAAMFGKAVLREVEEKEVLKNAGQIREKLGDRAFLRAIHFFEENKRVEKQVQALRENSMDDFLKLIKSSGDSSYKYLQNVYTTEDVKYQNVSVALAVSDIFLGTSGVSRVHGGGFAGTIQAFVKNDQVMAYKTNMDSIFGEGACDVLKVRKYGGIQVM